jgi:hypothetical protein
MFLVVHIFYCLIVAEVLIEYDVGFVLIILFIFSQGITLQ